jgi:hypothetical protein
MEIDQTLPLELKEGSVFAASTLVCSAYCDVNIKLSDTIMPLPNEVTCNVHGVRSEFLAIGDRTHEQELLKSIEISRTFGQLRVFKNQKCLFRIDLDIRLL